MTMTMTRKTKYIAPPRVFAGIIYPACLFWHKDYHILRLNDDIFWSCAMFINKMINGILNQIIQVNSSQNNNRNINHAICSLNNFTTYHISSHKKQFSRPFFWFKSWINRLNKKLEVSFKCLHFLYKIKIDIGVVSVLEKQWKRKIKALSLFNFSLTVLLLQVHFICSPDKVPLSAVCPNYTFMAIPVVEFSRKGYKNFG